MKFSRLNKRQKKKVIEEHISSYFKSHVIPSNCTITIYCDACIPELFVKKLRKKLKKMIPLTYINNHSDLKHLSDDELTEKIFEDAGNGAHGILPILITRDEKFWKQYPGISIIRDKDISVSYVYSQIEKIQKTLNEYIIVNLNNLFESSKSNYFK